MLFCILKCPSLFNLLGKSNFLDKSVAFTFLCVVFKIIFSCTLTQEWIPVFSSVLQIQMLLVEAIPWAVFYAVLVLNYISEAAK